MVNIFDEILEDQQDKIDFKNEVLSDYNKAEYLQKLLINISTNDGTADNNHYIELRKYFINLDENKRKLVPKFLFHNRDLKQFWQFIKYKFPTYAERRQYIWDSFNSLLDSLEAENQSEVPFTESIDENIRILNSVNIMSYWKKALERKDSDPEGAITISRTLVESVLKHILEEKNIPYDNNDDLHDIYKMVANELNLSPEQHDIELFKKILGGCSSIISGLGRLRNKHGDAHGKGNEINYRPSHRHAELSVNLAGSMCLFLIQTFQESIISED